MPHWGFGFVVWNLLGLDFVRCVVVVAIDGLMTVPCACATTEQHTDGQQAGRRCLDVARGACSAFVFSLFRFLLRTLFRR